MREREEEKSEEFGAKKKNHVSEAASGGGLHSPEQNERGANKAQIYGAGSLLACCPQGPHQSDSDQRGKKRSWVDCCYREICYFSEIAPTMFYFALLV